MIRDLGLIDYSEALKLQRDLVEQRRLGKVSDTVLIAEHPAVFTIGRSGSRKNLLVSEEYLKSTGIKVLDVDRGGDITCHSPGQIVIYPVLDLKNITRDLHKYLRDLEEAAINFFARYSVSAGRVEGATGVWFNDKKVASIGIGVKDWVTYHGLSINVNNDTTYFSMMNTCGFRGLKVTSLKEILGIAAPFDNAKRILVEEFCSHFGFKWVNNGYGLCAAMA